jgi:hypothetical protein
MEIMELTNGATVQNTDAMQCDMETIPLQYHGTPLKYPGNTQARYAMKRTLYVCLHFIALCCRAWDAITSHTATCDCRQHHLHHSSPPPEITVPFRDLAAAAAMNFLRS